MNNQFQAGPFGNNRPVLPGPGRPVPVVNGGVPAKPMGQVPAAPGFIPIAPLPPQPSQMAAAASVTPPAPPRAQKAAPRPPAAPQTPGAIPIGSKAECPVCRPFGR